MRILILSNIFPPGFIGGYELGALDVAHGLARRGHAVEVLTSNVMVDDAGTLPFPVHRVLQTGGVTRTEAERMVLYPLEPFSIPFNTRQMVGALIRFRPDRVLCFNLAWLGAPALLHALTAIGYRPALYFMDNMFARYAINAEGRAGFARSFGHLDWLDRVHCIFMSRTVRAEAEADFGRAIPGGTIIPGWFDRAALAGAALPRSDAPPPREDAPRRFLFASRITEAKGAYAVLDAARMVLDRGHDGFTIDLIGADGAAAAQRLSALGLERHASYRGALPKAALLGLYAQYEALLFPTQPREPFGFVVSEAAAAGCLPVMTAGIGASEWFLDGVDCLKIANTAEGVAAAMERLITMPAGERTRMRARARATAARFFDFDHVLTTIEAVLARADGPAVAPPAGMRAVEAALEVLTDVWRRGTHG